MQCEPLLHSDLNPQLCLVSYRYMLHSNFDYIFEYVN